MLYARGGINIFAQFFYSNIMTYILIFFLSTFPLGLSHDLEKSILSALNRGNGKEISKYFNSSVRISIHADNRLATKFQAELILVDYLNRNKLVDIKKSTPNGDVGKNCVILDAVSNKKKVRIFIKLVNLKGEDYISEFRID